MMATAFGYVILSIVRKAPLRVHGFEMQIPSLALSLGRLLASIADWALAVAVLYALLPEGGPSYGILLGPYLTADRIIAALLLYRLVYYILPLTLALVVLVGDVQHFAAWSEQERAAMRPYVATPPGILRDTMEGLLLWVGFQL